MSRPPVIPSNVQNLLDSLTDHIAVYHSATTSSKTTSAPRATVLRWFSSLSISHRQSSLTVVDAAFVSVLLAMLSRLRRAPDSRFFLLPDIPDPSDHSLPSLCSRRSSGLLSRLPKNHSIGLASSLLLFSSAESPSSGPHHLDTVTVIEELVADVDKFVEVMDGVSGGNFLQGEEGVLAKPWAEMTWLKDKGYYSMEAFLANKLEVALRLSWLNSPGGKKQKGGKGKEKGVAADIAGVAANAYWRKKGCLDWWMSLEHRTRKEMLATVLGKAARSLADTIYKEPNITLSNENCSHYAEAELFQDYGSSTPCHISKHSISKAEDNFCLDVVSVPCFRRSRTISKILKRLIIIKEISAMYLVLQHEEPERNALLFSKLESLGSIPDFVFRIMRGLIMTLSTDIIKAELMEEEEKNLPSIGDSKLASRKRRGKTKSRKPKSLNTISKGSNINHGLHEKSSTQQCDMNSLKDPIRDNVSDVADQKQNFGSTLSDKAVNVASVSSKDRANRKKGRRKGAKSKSLVSDGCTKVENTEFELKNTVAPSFAFEDEQVEVSGPDDVVVYTKSDHSTSDDILPHASLNCLLKRDVTGKEEISCVDNLCPPGADGYVGGDGDHLNPYRFGDSITSTFELVTVDECGRKRTSLGPPVNPQKCSYKPTSYRFSRPKSVTTAGYSSVPVSESPGYAGNPISQSSSVSSFLEAGRHEEGKSSQAESSDGCMRSCAVPICRPYEWPNMVPFNCAPMNSQHIPAAADRLNLDVGNRWPNHFHQSFVPSRHQARSSTLDGAHSAVLPSVSMPMSYDWPPMVKGCTRLGQSVALGCYDFACTPNVHSPLCSGFSGHGLLHHNAFESDMQHSGDFVDFYDSRISSEWADESDSYWLSEEEPDNALSGQDYNQVFGGGIMYWNTAEYVGAGFSRPPSYSSEDSSWAWRDADLNRAIDDMVGMPTLSTSYSANGLSSPPSASFCSPFDPLGSGNQPVNYTVPGNDANGVALQLSASMSDGVAEKVSRSSNTLSGGGEGMKGDSLPYQRLRPIVVSSIARKGSRSEFKLSHDLKSPCLASTIMDPPRLKRPPSPVVLCVPRLPRPPPPSPVGESRKRGLPIVRSGSSSPRHWGTRSSYHEGNSEETALSFDGAEVVWPSWRNKGFNATAMVHPIQDTVLQNHLLAISHLSRDQEHPDVSLPVQCPDMLNSPTHKTSLPMLHNFLHEEIDYFCKQVVAKNLTRKPYVNWAVKRVTRSLQVLWPRSRTNVFGSTTTGLALPTSDVDVVVSLPPVRNLEPIKEAGILEGRNGIKETCLQHAARYLANQEWVRNDSLKTIENTAIPVIMLMVEVPHDIISSSDNSSRVNTTESQSSKIPVTEGICHSDGFGLENDPLVSCSKGQDNDASTLKSIRLDISFRSPSHTGLQTSELVRELTQQFPASVPLALVLKQFLADRSLDHSYSGGLSSYCLILLITRFLQHEHHLGRQINQNLGALLMDFLYFFGNVFDPRQMRVSIQGAGVYMKRERGHSIDPIHIDDPLHPTNNVGRNCFRIHQCIKAFADAYTLLEDELSQLSDSCSTTSKLYKILPKIIPSVDLEG